MFRNREFRLLALLFLTQTVIGSAVGFIISIAAGILAVVLSAALWTLVFIFTKKRYKSLARLSEQIDIVLHDEDRIEWGDFKEGELSILQSDIKKMIMRIREQNDALRKDKQYLADSLADIAHQLRTPLTSANLALSLTTKTADENEMQGFIREAEGLFFKRTG